MPTYRNAEKEVGSYLKNALGKFHHRLKEHGVTVGVLFAHAPRDKESGEPKGPALKHEGYPAAAVIKINNQKDRVEGKTDATIVVDGDKWADWSDEYRTALIDHELTHLELDLDDDKAVKLDDCNRPKLKMRLHDWQIGGFEEVARRHGDDSPEKKQTKALHDKHGQLLFPWG